MEVNFFSSVLTGGGTASLCAWLLGVDLGKEGLADLVLLEVILPVLPHALLSSEHSFAAFVLAVEVLRVLYIALLEAAAFLGIKS